MILKFLSMTLLIGQCIIPAVAEDVSTLSEVNQAVSSTSLPIPLTDDTKINFYIKEADQLHVTLKSSLKDLNDCEHTNKQLIEDHIQRKDFTQRLEVTSQVLDRIKVLAIKANSSAASNHERFLFNQEFSVLASMVVNDSFNTLGKVSTYNFATIDGLNIPNLQAIITLLSPHDILTLSNAQNTQDTLDTLTIQLQQNVDHLNIQQQKTEATLKIGAVRSTLMRDIALAYVQAEKNTLNLIEDHLNGK